MRIIFLVLLLQVPAAQAQVTHYWVKLTPDLAHQVLQGEETIEFHHAAGNVEWHKQSRLHVSRVSSRDGGATLKDEIVIAHVRANGKHLVHFEYTAAPARGITWFQNQMGFDTAFYCDTWMVCDDSPGQRATLTLEIILPASTDMTAVCPGLFRKQWHDGTVNHFVFVQSVPVQTYLFSFGVAKLNRSTNGNLIFYTPDADPHKVAVAKTARCLCVYAG